MLTQAFRTIRFHSAIKRLSKPLRWIAEAKARTQYAGSVERLLRSLSHEAFSGVDSSSRIVRMIRTRSDVVVVLLAEHNLDESTKILKLPLTSGAVQSTDAHRNVLVTLQHISELEAFANKLPQPLGRGTFENQPYYIETTLPGEDASTLLRQNRLPQIFLQDAARIICQLHLATGIKQIVGDAEFFQLVGSNLESLKHILLNQPSKDQFLRKLAELEQHLQKTLIGSTLLFSWVHGDYWPGNILFSLEKNTVTGIIDWDRASEKTFSLMDVLHLIAYTYKLRNRISLGEALVTHLLPANFTPEEHSVLIGAIDTLGLPTGKEFLRSAVLVYWLQFVVANLKRYPAFEHNSEWMQENVFLVLEQSVK